MTPDRCSRCYHDVTHIATITSDVGRTVERVCLEHARLLRKVGGKRVKVTPARQPEGAK